MGLRAHTFSNYSMLSVQETHGMLCDMISREIALWVSVFMRAAQRSSPAVVPPAACAVFHPPPMPAFVPTLEFCRGGGEVLRLVLSIIGSGADRPSSGRPPLPRPGRPGQRKRSIQVSPRPTDVRAHR